MALLDTNNRCGWQSWFTTAMSSLENFTGISRQALHEARQVLVAEGLIECRLNGHRAASYHLIPLYQESDTLPLGTIQAELLATLSPEETVLQDETLTNARQPLDDALTNDRPSLDDCLTTALPLNKEKETRQNKTK